MSMVSKLHGKELSFNNLLDLDAGRALIEDFELPAVAIIKHNNPCGTALAAAVGEAAEIRPPMQGEQPSTVASDNHPDNGAAPAIAATGDIRGAGPRRVRPARSR